MYVPPLFKTTEADAWAFVEARAFATVVAVDGTRPMAASVPILIDRSGATPIVQFHLARNNPMHGVLARAPETMLLVDGPDAYLSPDWYDLDDQVPTWTYLKAELRGTARILAADEFLTHVDRLSAVFENRLLPKKPWVSAKMTPVKRDGMLKAIVCVEVVVTAIEASFKLAQTKAPEARNNAARHLAERPSEDERTIARHMLATIKPA